MEKNRGQDSGGRGQLRPCPFCGNKEIGMYGTESDFIYKDGTPMRGTFYYAECEHCGCSLGPAPSEEMLIENWNRRTVALRLSHVDGAGFGLIGHCHDCGTAVMSSKWQYCPECGAKLEWGE